MKIAEVHRLLNHLYLKADSVEQALKAKRLSPTRGNYTNHFIRIGKRYELQRYYIPVLTVKGKGDIGFNIDCIFFERGIAKKNVTKTMIEKMIRTFSCLEIYGYEDCCSDYYAGNKDAAGTFERIKASAEKKIQFNVSYPIDKASGALAKNFLKMAEILGKN